MKLLAIVFSVVAMLTVGKVFAEDTTAASPQVDPAVTSTEKTEVKKEESTTEKKKGKKVAKRSKHKKTTTTESTTN